MSRKITMILSVLTLSLMVAVPAFAEGPSFEPAIYADGVAWGTKGLGELPAPNEQMMRSFDKLYIITNGAAGQLPVSEAGPGNPAYNGGRWAAQTVIWTGQAFMDHGGTVPVLMSYADIQLHESFGHLVITPGSPGGEEAPPDYFECPLLPVK